MNFFTLNSNGLSTVSCSGNVSVFTKISLEPFTGLESNLRAEIEETRLFRRSSNIKIRADMDVFM